MSITITLLLYSVLITGNLILAYFNFANNSLLGVLVGFTNIGVVLFVFFMGLLVIAEHSKE